MKTYSSDRPAGFRMQPIPKNFLSTLLPLPRFFGFVEHIKQFQDRKASDFVAFSIFWRRQPPKNLYEIQNRNHRCIKYKQERVEGGQPILSHPRPFNITETHSIHSKLEHTLFCFSFCLRVQTHVHGATPNKWGKCVTAFSKRINFC